ncbi:CHAT domain-containing tetratricopeptide repeat protein [Hyalangium minutum]|uniref:CHAT domain-containing protein n=1 Tax=Hyalangium minutum TaxID=394096 RepID=A0A085W704_9BACT|nr:CHAT domain-containing tetratricopeptide repeat protein [Hyalangium minutum]KFE63467.1 hypothetical protein DB31_2585 [Hyalangium minutum]
MHRALTTALLITLSGACATVERPRTDSRLEEAQKAWDEGQRLNAAGKYADALPLIQQALRLREEALTEQHPSVADCINLLGELHVQQGDLSQAEPLLTRALQLRERLLGERHPDVARTLNSMAALHFYRGRHTEAVALSERALRIQEETLGPHHPDVAESLNNLAALYHTQGLFTQAIPLFERALAIWVPALGERHPLVANTLNNLAMIYVSQGHFARAEPLFKRALEIREALLGKNHPDIALTLQSLALLYSAQGLYARAAPLAERALAIREAALGPTHPEVALALANLAINYQYLGLDTRAEELHLRALALREKSLGPNHPDVAHSLSNLAALYMEQGLHERAEPLQLRALQIREAALGADHLDVARSLQKLAALYLEQGLYERAEPLLLRALKLGEAALGETHPSLANWRATLARLYTLQGRYAQALSLYQRVLSIQRAALGEAHPDLANSLHGTALLRLAEGRFDEAVPLFEQAFTASEQHLRQQVLGLSEQRLASFLNELRAHEAELYAFVRAHRGDRRVLRLALSSALLRKGRSVQEIAQTSHIISRSLNPADREAFERLRTLRTHFATLSLAGPGNLPLDRYQQRLKELSREGDTLEAELAERSAPLRRLQALPSREQLLPRVAEALPPESALIELVAYQDHPLQPPPGVALQQVPSHLRYLALLLFPDGATQAVDLGPAEPIDRAAQRLHDALSHESTSYLPAARALYTLAFRPLEPHLRKARRLFLSPDGRLNLVPFAALHDGQRYLVDTFHITYLTSGKDLLARAEDRPSSTSVVILADPAFSAALDIASPGDSSPPKPTERSVGLQRLFSTLRSEEADVPWTPLPGTRVEAETLHRLLPQAQLLLGADATKQALLNLSTPGVLHIATHGFFLEDAHASPGSRAVGHFGAVGASLPEPPSDPLLRSGLVLAGIRPATAPSGAPRPEDSLATALELTGLNLWGTQLVVLSACDTGRGKISLGDGVYGLRRAFLVAGAETLVTSLWKIRDEVTHQLMEGYYRHLLAGEDRSAALREAMREFRQKHPHPHFWAPFISLGRDAPLQGLAPSPPAASAP